MNPDGYKEELSRIQFDFDGNALKSSMQQQLLTWIDYLNQYPDISILIEGHTDERGSSQYNLALGERRANAVKTYLEREGISEERINTFSYGESKPINFKHNEKAWYENRRVELSIEENNYEKLSREVSDLGQDIMLEEFLNRTINKIIFHHIINDSGVKNIQRSHMNFKKYADIGYNYIIDSYGDIYLGRDEKKIYGAHVKNYNYDSIGLAYTNSGLNGPNKQQIETLQLMTEYLSNNHPEARLFGHSDFEDTECPGDYEYKPLREQTTDEIFVREKLINNKKSIGEKLENLIEKNYKKSEMDVVSYQELVYCMQHNLDIRDYVNSVIDEIMAPVEMSHNNFPDNYLPNAPRDYRNGAHEGFDFAIYKKNVFAIADGRVIKIVDVDEMTIEEYTDVINEINKDPDNQNLLNKLYGKYIVIECLTEQGDKLQAKYMHLDEINEDLEIGMFVHQGDVLGISGNTGTSGSVYSKNDQYHLHFEIWSGEKYFGEGLTLEEMRYALDYIFYQENINELTDLVKIIQDRSIEAILDEDIDDIIDVENLKNQDADNEELKNTPLHGLMGIDATNNGEKIKGIYIKTHQMEDREAMVEFLKTNELNAIVVDIKDKHGEVLFDTSVDQAEKIGAEDIRYSKEDIEYFQSNDIYVIGKLAAFKDPVFGKHFIDSTVLDIKKNKPYKFHIENEEIFLDPSDRLAQKYILDIAADACQLGFDEIQFDFIRYPVYRVSDAELVFDLESSYETRTETISKFLSTAKEMLNARDCIVSADIFGWALTDYGDVGIGQNLEKISHSVDYLYAMVYQFSYDSGNYGLVNPSEYPYDIVHYALTDGLERMDDTEKMRVYLQGFDADIDAVRDSIRAADEHGVSWLLFNQNGSYSDEYFATDEQVFDTDII